MNNNNNWLLTKSFINWFDSLDFTSAIESRLLFIRIGVLAKMSF
jgi:hypothetical protein